ncbi:MAG: PQQ-binding-like beta-propeller repeat protein, partial [Verrucomicrobiota bacterium]
DGTIYVGSLDKSFYAVSSTVPDSATDAERTRWIKPTGGQIFAAAAIGRDGTVYFGSDDSKVYAIAADGTMRWEHPTLGSVQAAPALGADGTIYVPSGDRNLYALNPTGPDTQRVKWEHFIGVSSASSPAVRSDGVIVLGADDNKVYAIKPNNTPGWTFDLGRPNDEESITSSPLIAPDGHVYIGSTNGNVYKIRSTGMQPLSAASAWPGLLKNTTHTGRASPGSTDARLINLSTRAQVASGAGPTLIVGFTVQSAGTRFHLLRAIGPGLESFGVPGFMPNPRLQLFAAPSGTALVGGMNDDWEPLTPEGRSLPEATQRVGGFALREGSKDAAVLSFLSGGQYTAHATSSDGVGGVVLVEAYDAFTPETVSSRLINVSTRNFVGTGANALIAGFVLGGSERTRLLLRGVGPGLTQLGVSGVLTRPMLTLYDAEGRPLRTNEGWTTGGAGAEIEAAGALVGAFRL